MIPALTLPGHNDWLYLLKSTGDLIILGQARDGMGSKKRSVAMSADSYVGLGLAVTSLLVRSALFFQINISKNKL